MAVKALINAAIDSARKARMQRAKDQGFGEDTYRGIYGDYDPSKQGYYQMFTSSPQDAGEYGDNVIKAKLRKGNNLEIDGRGKNFNDIYIGGLPSNVFDKLHSSVKESLTARTDDIAHAAKAAGYDSVTIKDIYDKVGNEIPLKPITKSNKNDVDMLSELGIDPNDPILNTGSTSVSKNVDIPRDYNTANIDIVFDPSNIRSVNAQFDPAKRTSSNLLASAAGAGVLGAGALAPQEAEAGPINIIDPITGLIRKGIEAWHGGPHTFPAERMVRYADGRTENLVGAVDRLPDVPAGAEVIQDYPLGRMRMDKIGTGEGAQAYGYGLYNADSQDVARGYRDTLSPKNVNLGDGAKAIDDGTAYTVEGMLNATKGDGSAAHEAIAARISRTEESGRKVPDSWRQLLGDLEPHKGKVYPRGSEGSLYRTELDVDPDTLLDWDKPLSEQPDNIKSALAPYMDAEGRFMAGGRVIDNPTGKQIYYNVVPDANDAAFATAKMQELGMPGIRYLDGDSRKAGEGSSNYVIFDDSKINIKERGMATPAALAVTAGVTGTGMALSDSPDYLDTLASQVNRGPEGSLYDTPQDFAAQQPYETPIEVAPQYQPPAIHSASALGEAFGATSRFIANKNPYVTALASQIDVEKEWDKPMARMYGLGAALKVLANGGTFENALLRGSKVGGQSIDEIGQELGEYVADKTGNPYAAAISKAIVTVASP